MAFREYDLLLAVDNEIRITSLLDAKSKKVHERSYKILYTPNIEFEICQMSVNPTGKLLAVAGAHQVAVVSLPQNYRKLVTSRVDCRTIQVGQFYHATNTAAPLSKIEWHPWGKNGCTLLVMTMDGILREYDLSMDPEEPQQILTFMPERSHRSSMMGDSSSRDFVSFCMGKGKADWGPLTVYALTKSGDVWAMCPFLPSNATVPAAYIHALEYFVRAKQEQATEATLADSAENGSPGPSLFAIYAYQLKYAIALSKQISDSSATILPTSSRSVNIHAPSIMRSRPMRQGPFLLQPSPHYLDGEEESEATDLVYIDVTGSSSLFLDDNGSEERLGALALAYSDGKVDVCLDVEKIEAIWEPAKHSGEKLSSSDDLPSLLVYETIDLGLTGIISMDDSVHKEYQEVLRLNRPVFMTDPIYQDVLYLYHSFGVHSLNMNGWLQPLVTSMRQGVEQQVEELVTKNKGTEVIRLLNTTSPQTKLPKPVYGLALPGDVYLSYSLYAVTSSLDASVRELTLRIKEDPIDVKAEPAVDLSSLPTAALDSIPELEAKEKSLVSLLAAEPYTPKPAVSPEGKQAIKKIQEQAKKGASSGEIVITPDTLRHFANTVQAFQSQIRDIILGTKASQDRVLVQDAEFKRQQHIYMEIKGKLEHLKGENHKRLEERFEHAISEQRKLLARSDRVLQQLMDSTSPNLNEYEKRWFAELKRMKVDVLGDSPYDAGSLKARTETLLNRLESYIPSLRELSTREAHRKDEARQNPVALGRGQELRVLMRLGEHKKMLSDTIKPIEEMAKKLNVELERIPELD
ncbi:hypothetical protein M422DRAFT_60999 [Sphaerobolus stellatus SS14]|uniref:Nucleoporin Nup82 n=1 Tax=Sphaerobolus stellatus (strain SS14) TaxID=990650 RepID=A0A0C9U3N9_SPHS4|nr:hypothetical protein M422DRAFT_60999 [Sphaerobolus stellatus SS14]